MGSDRVRASRPDVITQTDKNQLERMIDAATLTDVLTALADICRAKAEHIDSTWQDRNLAALWNRAAGRIERVADGDAIRAL